mmetsp:Transcript_32653/g.75913  ORF Transcript_32653/g.75913 Transcript_32653/m.75913 type:complete len:290 (+) Transcript_32653:334-1203(+)
MLSGLRGSGAGIEEQQLCSQGGRLQHLSVVAPSCCRSARSSGHLLATERGHSLQNTLNAEVRLPEETQCPELGLRKVAQHLIILHPQPHVPCSEKVGQAGWPIQGRVRQEVVWPELCWHARLLDRRKETEVEAPRLVGFLDRLWGSSLWWRCRGHGLLEVRDEVLATLNHNAIKLGAKDGEAWRGAVVLPTTDDKQQALQGEAPQHIEDLLAATFVQPVLHTLNGRSRGRSVDPVCVGPARHSFEGVCLHESLHHNLDFLVASHAANVRLEAPSADVSFSPRCECLQGI